MKHKLYLILLIFFACLNISSIVNAKEKSVDEFYSSLPQKEHVYKEYKNATLNIREKVNGSDLDVIQKKLGRYALLSLPTDYRGQVLYFFASVYEDKRMIVKKSVFYDLNGKFLEANFTRTAKKEAVLNGEFDGWDGATNSDELADDNPLD
ncbi:hypothetical protein [Rummeliibacillus pycnus]|uniref:hypothetical protein n=1 Tax=Rummeliibacillus pycnus TaxID=101070 RepID=UPI0037C9DB24